MSLTPLEAAELLSTVKSLKASLTLAMNELIVIEGKLEGIYPPAGSKLPEITDEMRARVLAQSYKRRGIRIITKTA